VISSLLFVDYYFFHPDDYDDNGNLIYDKNKKITSIDAQREFDFVLALFNKD